MNLFRLLTCVWIALLASAAQWPGPQQTEMENGVEVWKAQASEKDDTVYTHKVNDLEARGARPTLVYNCHIVPALCANARTRLGGKTSTTRHFDKASVRATARRKHTCPTSWIKDHDCPENGQPKKFWYYMTEAEVFDQRDWHLWRGRNGLGEKDRSHFAKLVKETHDLEGNVKESWSEIGAQFSCDEWPAASWIEGGQGANTYCSPKGRSCKDKNGKPRFVYLNTEQDWQGKAHSKIFTWYDSFPDQWEENEYETPVETRDLNYEIFKFNFKLVDEPDTKFGTWVEALGRKRYCYPPGNINNDCKPRWSEDPDGLFQRGNGEGAGQ